MAMEADEENGVKTLISRSKAYSGLPNHEKARADSELAVQRQPDKPSVLENDAYSLYAMDRFEAALVGYHRGLRIRQKPDYFSDGVLVATETVEDCIGRHAGDMLAKNNLGDTILRIWLKEQNLIDPWIKTIESKPHNERMNKIQLEKFFGEKYLSRLKYDKQFLFNCEDNTQLYSGNLDSYLELQNVLKDALEKVNRRQKTLMRYKPMYVHKMRNSTSKMSAEMKKNLELRQSNEELAAAKLAFHLVNLAREAQIQHDTPLCIRTAERAREFIRNQPLRLIREKRVYMKCIYQVLGDLYLGMKEFLPLWKQDENDFRILYMIGVKASNESSEEHLRKTFLPYIPDPKGLLEESEKEMAYARTAIERAYLYHEMSRCCNQLEKFELARTMGRRCAQEARPAKSLVWVINGMFMVARFESLQRNYVDAKNTITEAIEVAKKLDNERVTDFLLRTLNLLDFASSLSIERSTILDKREKDMLALMPSRDMRMKMALIFTSMKRLPVTRRMMLVPGVVPVSPVKKKTKSITAKDIKSSQKLSVRDRRRTQACEGDHARSLNRVPPSVRKDGSYLWYRQ